MVMDLTLATLIRVGLYPPASGYGPAAPKRNYVPALWLQPGPERINKPGLKSSFPSRNHDLMLEKGGGLLTPEGNYLLILVGA
jgi:hypothetical protein